MEYPKGQVLKFIRSLTPPLIANLVRNGKSEKELRKIRKQPRFKEGFSGILEKKLKYTDSASFCFIFDEIFRKKIYQFKSSSKHPHIIDAGANIGLSTIYFKLLYPEAKIIAFEPDEKAYNALQYNVNSFGLNDVQLIKKGIWNDNTRLKFYAEGADGGRIATASEGNQIVDIEVERLAPYLDNKIDFLKMDIEGVEVNVIKDCQDRLVNVENIFVEYHSFANQPQQLHALLKILSDAGFRYAVHHVGTFSPQPFVKINKYMGMDFQLNIYGYRT